MTRLFPALALSAALALPLAAQEPTRQLHHVTGDVYLFQNNFHNSLVVSTSEGTVRVDPINAEAGAWLNENLSTIDAPPVSHLIYSHSHGDHGSGGSAHPDATVIAHEDAPEMLDDTTPTMRVGDSHVLEVGGKTFELTNLGSGHDNHMLAVVVRPENVAFIVDVAAPNLLPWRDFGGANVDDWIGQIEAVDALDFEVFAPGHGQVGDKADVQENLDYFADLRSGVLEGLKAGKTVDKLKAELTLDDYADWGRYEQMRELNIEGMANYLQSAGLVN